MYVLGLLCVTCWLFMLARPQELFVWKEFPMHLPPTVIDKLEEMKIDLRQVFRSPLSDVYSEIGLLSGDQENVFGHLSKAQLSDVWSTGALSVSLCGVTTCDSVV